ncbi:MarR family transcriptional regulator [Corynebacterium sp.]|jgi:predicted NBD/HSP70 family sugar kinase|uniref:ROK family transcriptional regulator n=1 Tax=Corynebacterium sp. TaxID=1720 RepID=UPI0025BCA29C|nr:MarR family transcriptional regulator [Corynebacterium sp.]
MTTARLSATAHFTAPVTGPARCLHQIRTTPGITRGRLHEDLGMSQPTVTRHVSALIDAGLVEQVSPTTAGGVGRPGTTLRPDGRAVTALGAHVGLRSTQLVAVDGAGRPLRKRTLRLPVADLTPGEAMEAVQHALSALGRDLPSPVGLGIAFSAHVDYAGRITSPSYGWEDVDPVAYLDPDLPVAVSTGVSAMAGSELTSSPLSLERDPLASTLYVYARELVGHAWIVGNAVHQPYTGSAPTAFNEIAGSGSFSGGHGHPLGSTAVLDAARHRGLNVSTVPDLVGLAEVNPVARAILDERAELLSRIISLAVDVVDPSTVVFAGETFTADPGTVRIIAESLRGTGRQLSIQRAGDGILSRAAAVTALHRLWQDPLAF